MQDDEEVMSTRHAPKGTFAVLGAGLMGQGIIELLSRAGHTVRYFDPGPTGHVDAPGQVLACVSVADAIEGAEIIFEAIFEDLDAKHDLYREIDATGSGALIASNTSTFAPSRLATGLQDPSRLLIAHFFNPAAVVPLVELVPGPQTSTAAVERLHAVLTDAGKTVVVLKKESTGFVANRLQAALYREAMHLVRENVASPETIDLVMTAGLAPRWTAAGPFLTMDRGGLDVWQKVCRQIFPTLDGETTTDLIDPLVDEHHLGVKTGEGFFAHTPGQTALVDAAVARAFAVRPERPSEPGSD